MAEKHLHRASAELVGDGYAVERGAEEKPLILTVGHSTRTPEDFIHLLQAHAVDVVADIRTIPRSRRNPQFNQETLPESLEAAGIRYLHLPGLGGLRHPRRDSANTAWRNATFRGFADYMLTDEFTEHLDKLVENARGTRLALMCAEALPWRCHRFLIADALFVRGITVEHILSPTRRERHNLSLLAKVEGMSIRYPLRPIVVQAERPNRQESGEARDE